MSSNVVTSFIKFEVNCDPSSVIITFGMYVCFKKICVRTSATVCAVTLLIGVAKRYFVKTSIAVITWVNPFDGAKGPMKSIWSISPGRLVSDVTGCIAGLIWMSAIGLILAHLRQFCIHSEMSWLKFGQ